MTDGGPATACDFGDAGADMGDAVIAGAIERAERLTQGGETKTLPLEWFHDIKAQVHGLWLIKRVLPAQGLALVYGHPGSGKSFFALDVALHVALGWDWTGRRVKQGLVIYVGAEGVAGLRNRVAAFRRHHELRHGIPFALIPTPIDLFEPTADTAILRDTIQLAAEAMDARPALIVIDTLSKTMGAGKENTDDMASYVANCQRIASHFGCLVMPVHHRPKDAESTEPRGHSSLKGGVDTIILVESGATKRAEITKQRDDEIGERFLFNLHVVELGTDEDGETVTSCVVQPTDVDMNPKNDPFAKAVSKLGATTRIIFDQLGELIQAAGVPVPPAIPDAEIDQFRVSKVTSLEAWRDKSISASGTGAGHNRDTGKRSFNRALPKLISAGVVRVWEDWAWITHSLSTPTGTDPGQLPGQDRDSGTGGTHPFRGVPLSRLDSQALEEVQ